MSDRMSDLVRALNLIPYFRSHPDHSLFEAAKDLGLEHRQIVADLQRLHTSGVGTHTEELIDLTFNANRTSVTITEDQGMTTPLRLTATEAGALLLVLESLESQLVEKEAAVSAAAKIRAHMAERTAGIFDAQPDAEDPDLVAVNDALARGRRLSFEYWAASSDEVSRRTVDPARLFLHEGASYLAAWDPERGAHRNFRIDRIRDARVLDDPSEPHLRQLPEDPFAFTREAEILIRADAAWLSEYHRMKLGHARSDGWVSATMPFGSEEWLIRFCLSHGDRIRLVQPEELSRRVAQRVTSALAGYDQSTARNS